MKNFEVIAFPADVRLQCQFCYIYDRANQIEWQIEALKAAGAYTLQAKLLMLKRSRSLYYFKEHKLKLYRIQVKRSFHLN